MKVSEKNSYVADGHLLPCPDRPNCVSSEGPQGNWSISPLEYSGPSQVAWQALQEEIVNMGGSIERSDDTFLHATFRSRIFGFVDDVTCRLDGSNNRIHIRSAARTGHSDFGVNRKRVEALRSGLISAGYDK